MTLALLTTPRDSDPVHISDNGREFPKDFRKNLEWRRGILKRAKRDLGYRAAVKELFFRDPLFAFNGFFWTLDVRKRPASHQPFCTYDFQDELILELKAAVDAKGDRLIEKSRDMGVTWCVLGTFAWFWLDPEGGTDFLVGSRIEDYVDKKGDPRTHFARLRYLQQRLPGWLRPKGFRQRDHDTHMKLVNPQTGATITGESNNANFSTQGRYSAILYDEFAKWEVTDESAWTAGGDASPSRIAVSTPFGAGGQFFKLVTAGKVRKLTYHWTRHPEKSLGLSCVWPPPNEDLKVELGERWEPKAVLRSPWYDRECERRSKTEIAQELDIDYLGSGNPVFSDKAWEVLVWMNQRGLDPVEAFEPMLGQKELKKVAISGEDDTEGLLLIYEELGEKAGYVLGVDVVEGTKDGDYAVVTVLNRRTKGVAGSYYSRLDEIRLAGVVWLVAGLFTVGENAPWVGIETPGPGLATFDACVALGVENLFMSPRYDVTNSGVSYKKGWRNDANSRPELIAGIREWLFLGGGRAHRRLVGELMTFVYSKTGKPIAKAGCHDDEVFGFGIALQVDELAPPVIDRREVRELNHSDAVDLRNARTIEEPSVEEVCFAQAMERRSLRVDEQSFWADTFWGVE